MTWLGELIVDILVRPILETVIGGLFYLTGMVFLKIVTVGQVDLAPLDTLHATNRTPKGERDWSIWLCRPGKRSALKAEWVIVAGVVVWGVTGLCIYQATKDRDPREKLVVPSVAE
ncbi:hypothetical protein [Luteolibacter soli]|uniref:Uncharacterized protein n=1 Tax=Luteolibacter soli TaxID=3135280 RepID=A0ABU9AWB4_9BACT